LIEKTITLDNVSLVDFLGTGNKNINELSSAFPKSRIVSRGNEILIKGENADVIQITDILNSLIDHFHQFGRITEENVRGYVTQEKQEFIPEDSPEGILLYGTKGHPIKMKTQNQQRLVQTVKENDLVFALGPAGTGKTYLAIAKAVEALEQGRVSRIVLSRPAVEAGESLGFLPGDLQEKLAPYLRPLYDALTERLGTKRLKQMLADGIIEIAPVAYMRGRTLSECFVVIDEAQNCTYTQIKMLLTRLGWRSTMVLTGDPDQTDLLPGISGLADIA